MLYLVGGAARVGKSKLARRLLAERGVPYLHLDLLMMGFARGLPKLGVDPETPAALRGEQLWPVVRGMAMTAVEDGVDYLFEGDLLLPGHAAELRAFRRDAVRAVFLGYSGITAEQKLRHIRASGGEPNDWVAGLADDRVLSIASTNIEFSGRLGKECAAHGLPYFDTSQDFRRALDSAFSCLSAY